MLSKEIGDTLARNAVFSVLSPARRIELAERATTIRLTKGVWPLALLKLTSVVGVLA